MKQSGSKPACFGSSFILHPSSLLTKMNCQHCQTLLLDHLYGLLEGTEGAGVDAHLATCPSCAAARDETARVQGLIARAAKATFPTTKFEQPVPVPQRSTTRIPAPMPAVLPFPANPARDRKTPRRIAAILPWAVAATVLLAIPGTVVPVLSVFRRADSTRREAEVAQLGADEANTATATVRRGRGTRLSDAQLKLVTAEQTQTALFNTWVDEQKTAVQTAAAHKITIDVLKPATVQPGAPNDFRLVVRDERPVWESRDTKLVAEIHTSDAVLFTQDLDHEKRGNEHAMRLPASAWSKLKPDSELTLVVSLVEVNTNARKTLQEVRLAGPVFTTLLVTDKPTYRPGERLFFRSLTLDRITLRPPQREQILRYDLVAGTNPHGRALSGLTATGTTELIRVNGDPNGRVEPVRTADGQPVRGVGCGEFVMPPDLADGEYTLVLRELLHPGGAPATMPLPVARTIKVRSGEKDTYAKLIGFTGASYAPGAAVEAWAELKFQDRPVQDAEVIAITVEADGVPLADVQVAPKTDATGRAKINFTLPDDVLNGDVRLKVKFRAAGREEVVADRVPVVGRRLVVEFFPECGDTIVAGVPCKVYVRATTPAGQPVDIRGVITDGRQTLATVNTLRDEEPGANRGLASFTFTPKPGTRVWLKPDAPNTVYAPIIVGAPVPVSAVALMGGPGAVAARTGFVLPETKIDGVVMSVLDTITSPGQPIRVHLHSVGPPRTIIVGAYVRGRLCDTQKVTVEPGQLAEVKLMAGSDPRGGVVRITAFEEVETKDIDAKPDLKPVAERLVFRRAGEVLKLSLAVSPADGSAPKIAYAAGTGLNCTISATDEKNNPVAAVLWAAVVNTGVAPGAKDRTMPTHFLLAGDVKNPDELEYADFLLTDHKHAGTALDLVLGTQGWRRFAEQVKTSTPASEQKQPPSAAHNPELTRLMVQNGQNAILAEPSAAREYRKIAETYGPLYERAVQSVARAKAALDAAQTEARDTRAIQQAESFAEVTGRDAADKRDRAEAARVPVRQFRSVVWYGVAGFAAIAMLCAGVSLARPNTRLPLGASTLGSFGLAAFLFVAAGWSDEARASARGMAANRDAEQPMTPGTTPELHPKGEAVVSRPPTKDGPPNGFSAKNDGSAKVTTNVESGGPPFAPPRAPNGPVKEPGYTLAFAPPPVFLPNATRGADAKGGFGGSGVGGLTVPVGPDQIHGVKPIAPPSAVGAPAPGGSYPHNRAGVTASDLEKHAPSFFGGTALRAMSDDRADALKKATDKAAWYADERQRIITDSLNAHLAGRAKAVGPENPITQFPRDGALTKEKVEALAIQQVRSTVAPIAPLVVREYAAPRPTPTPLLDATDAPDTILWQPVMILSSDGETVVNFHLGDATGGYRVVVAGHTADGRLGEARTVIAVAKPQTTVLPGVPTTPSTQPEP